MFKCLQLYKYITMSKNISTAIINNNVIKCITFYEKREKIWEDK